MKKLLLRVVQVLVTIGVLVWVFRDSQMRANIPAVLRQADPRWRDTAPAITEVCKRGWRSFRLMLSFPISIVLELLANVLQIGGDIREHAFAADAVSHTAAEAGHLIGEEAVHIKHHGSFR